VIAPGLRRQKLRQFRLETNPCPSRQETEIFDLEMMAPDLKAGQSSDAAIELQKIFALSNFAPHRSVDALRASRPGPHLCFAGRRRESQIHISGSSRLLEGFRSGHPDCEPSQGGIRQFAIIEVAVEVRKTRSLVAKSLLLTSDSSTTRQI
jgi:hypothetical protein